MTDCLICGKSISVSVRGSVPRFCGTNCRHTWNSQACQCEICGNRFLTRVFRSTKRRFCSCACTYAARSNGLVDGPPRKKRALCLSCGADHLVANQHRRWNSGYCSKSCYDRGAAIACADCGTTTYRLPAKRRTRCSSCQTAATRDLRKWTSVNRHRLKYARADASERFNDREIFERDGWCCQLCHRKINPKFSFPDGRSASVDHIVPLSRGGFHIRSNVHAAHLSCNMKKKVRAVGEQLLLVG